MTVGGPNERGVPSPEDSTTGQRNADAGGRADEDARGTSAAESELLRTWRTRIERRVGGEEEPSGPDDTRLTAPRMVVFAPSVSGDAPAPSYDEAHEIVFDALSGTSGDDDPAPSRRARRRPRGRAAVQFWLWSAGNASLIGIVIGAALFALGMSLRQALLAAALGSLASVVPIAVVVAAGRVAGSSGGTTRVVFGARGRLVPIVAITAVRLGWGAVLLWILTTSVGRIVFAADFGADPRASATVALVAAVLVVAVCAALGRAVVERVQLVVAVVAGVLAAAFVVATLPRVDTRVAAAVGDGDPALVLAGAVLVFSVFGVLWSASMGDLPRTSRTGAPAAASVSWASAGALVPALVLVGYGAVLAASDPAAVDALVSAPTDALSALLPSWYPVPLLVAVTAGLVAAVTVGAHASARAVSSMMPRMGPRASAVSSAVVMGAIAALLGATVGGVEPVLRDLATTLAVPVSAWVGVVGTALLVRRRALVAATDAARASDSASTARASSPARADAGVLVGFGLAVAVGYGLTTAAVPGLGWQGYLLPVVGLPADGALAQSDLGVFAALLIGLAAPLFLRRDVAGQTRPSGAAPVDGASAPDAATLQREEPDR